MYPKITGLLAVRKVVKTLLYDLIMVLLTISLILIEKIKQDLLLFANEYIPGKVTVYASKIENQYKEAYILNYFSKQANTLIYSGFNTSNKFF